MKIAIEAQRIFRPNKHGMDFVALETIRELQKIDTTNEYRIYVAPGEDRCLNESANFKIIELDSSLYPYWEQCLLPRAVDAWGADLLHCTSNTAPLKMRTPLIVTLHDVIFMEQKQISSKSFYQRMGREYRRLVVPHVVERAKKIITVSHYEREQIREQFPNTYTKTEVVYNGYNSHFYYTLLSEETHQKYSLPEKYFFHFGNTDPKKNTPRTIEAYALYLEMTGSKVALVVGDIKREVLRSMVSADIWSKVEKHIATPGYISNIDMPQIYSAAELFLYTSLRESFGIPLLEAMACGTPVISSNTSAIPEIAGTAAMLCDPYDAKSITSAIINANTEILSRDGLLRVQCFSWQNTAIQTLNLYNSLRK